jgi:hypothetical protein
MPRRWSLPQQPKFTNDWEKERKKVRILALVLVALFAVVAFLFLISVLRGHF